MSTTEQEIDEVLDNLELEQEETIESDDVSLDAQNLTVDDEVKDKPPGFIGYDDWIAKGKDPADFRGENAYKSQYEALKEVRELKDTMSHVVEGMESWKSQQNELKAQEIEQARKDAVAQLEQAKEDDDTNAALAAQERINGLDKQSQTQPAPINPIITDFANKNPIIDPDNTQYDPDFHQDMIMIHNSKLDQLLGGDRSRAGELTQEQIERVQALAFSQAKELHPNKFVSQRNKRQTAPQSRQRQTQAKGDDRARLKSVSNNARNPRDDNAGQDIYDYLKEIDPSGKQAEVFAKNVLGES